MNGELTFHGSPPSSPHCTNKTKKQEYLASACDIALAPGNKSTFRSTFMPSLNHVLPPVPPQLSASLQSCRFLDTAATPSSGHPQLCHNSSSSGPAAAQAYFQWDASRICPAPARNVHFHKQFEDRNYPKPGKPRPGALPRAKPH